MHKFKNVLGILCAVALMAGTVFGVSAAEIGEGTVESDDTTVLIPKSINVTNPEDITVWTPAITYSYTIRGIQSQTGTTVTDAEGHRVSVRQGPEGGAVLPTGTVAFDSMEVVANGVGNEVEDNLEVNIDITKFEQPGIYRYEVKDVTETDTLAEVGIERNEDYDLIRYLDVYIIRDQDTGELKVSGYALTNGYTLDPNHTGYPTESIESEVVGKSSGYVSRSEIFDDYTYDIEGESQMTDTYDTYNVQITKQVTGDMGDTSHQFPFDIIIAGQGDVAYSHGKKAVADTDPDLTTGATDEAISTTLANSEFYVLKGLSPLATVGVTETNDTYDGYTVTVMDENGDELVSDADAVAFEGEVELASFQVSDYEDPNVEAAANTQNLNTFDNHLDNVSPTGVILASAPFLAMAGVGGAMLVAGKKKKKETE